MNSDRDNKVAECQSHVKRALAATLDTCRPGLASKYRISDDDARDAIGWAAISIALDNHLASSNFSEQQRQAMHIHINYLIHGAVGFSKYFSEDNE